MRKILIALVALVALAGCAMSVQEQRAALERSARALGALEVKTIEFAANGVHWQPGQSMTPGFRWPRYNYPSFTRSANYETSSPSPFNVTLADNIARLNLAVDRLLPGHGRMVLLAELHRTIGR
jgi:uncharacterized lipoprotein